MNPHLPFSLPAYAVILEVLTMWQPVPAPVSQRAAPAPPAGLAPAPTQLNLNSGQPIPSPASEQTQMLVQRDHCDSDSSLARQGALLTSRRAGVPGNR